MQSMRQERVKANGKQVLRRQFVKKCRQPEEVTQSEEKSYAKGIPHFWLMFRNTQMLRNSSETQQAILEHLRDIRLNFSETGETEFHRVSL